MTFVPSFPLLARELTERAAQRRTYVMRVVHAVLLFAPFGFFYSRISPGSAAGWMGVGRELFVTSIGLQMAGTYLFLPAMMCGVFTQEKERGSIGLLLLTRLGTVEIVFQKLCGGLVPMFSFLALSLPIAALCYGLGGLNIGEMIQGAWFLALSALHVGSIALCASVWCRTTPGAYLLTCLLAYPAPALALAFAPSARGLMSWLWLSSPFVPALGWLELMASTVQPGWNGVAVLFCVPALAVIGAILFCACELLPLRAFVHAEPWLPTLLRRIDAWMAGSIRIPGASRWIAAPELRLTILLECILVPLALLVAAWRFGSEEAMLRLDAFLVLLAALAVLGAMTLGVNAFMSERVRQTLDVLLATPLSAARMMGHKASFMHRLVLSGLLPAGSLIAIAAASQAAFFRWHPHHWDETGLFVSTALLTFLVDLPLVWWLSLWLAASSRARTPAMLRALGGVSVFLALPSLVLMLAGVFAVQLSKSIAVALVLLSPLEILRMSAGYGARSLFGEWWPLAVVSHVAGCGALLCAIQQRCLRRAEHYLRG